MLSAEEELLKIRKRIKDAVELGLFDSPTSSSGVAQETLIQIINEAHRGEQNCLAEIERLRWQLETLKGKAQGFSAMRSVVYAVLNGMVSASEKSVLEDAEERTKEEEPEMVDEKRRGRRVKSDGQ